MLIAVYGTLMSGGSRAGALEPYADLVGPCRIRGDLYSVSGMFPALVPGDGEVKGELWRSRNQHATTALLRMTDAIESFYQDDWARSMYLRRAVTLIQPEKVAWTYVWNRDLERLDRIPSGDWREYREGVWA